MELKARLEAPFEKEDRLYFIVTNNHELGYTIIESESVIEAWGYTEEEIAEIQAQRERERVASLNLTKADFWIALWDRRITKDMVKEKINLIDDEELRVKTLIRLDEADHFWRGDPSMDIIGAMFGLTSDDLTYLFEHKELPSEDEVLEENTNTSDETDGELDE